MYSLQLQVQLLNQTQIQIQANFSNTIEQIKQAIQNKNPQLTADQMNLFLDERKLRNTETISQCGISNSSLLVQKKIDLDEMPEVQITTEPDCITFDDVSFLRAQMPCGHGVSSESMTSFLQSLIKAKKFEIKCPANKGKIIMCEFTTDEPCETIWPYELCRKVGVLTLEEKQQFEVGIEESYVMKQMGGKQCPACSSWIIKGNITENRVRCPNCAGKNQAFDFCWKCLKKWQPINAFTQKYPCGNNDCSNKELNELLLNCKTKKIGEIEGVPEYRVCSKCQTIIQHEKNCKHMTCKQCKLEFCFVCLSIKEGGKWKCGSPSSICDVAARQQL